MSSQHWDFDLVHSSVNFHVRHLMVSKVHGRFQKWSGKLELDDAEPAKSHFEVEIEATSIETQEAKRDEHLRSPDFLDVAAHPTIKFRSTKITKRGDDAYEAAGELTIRGTTRPVVLEVEGGTQVKDPWGGTRTGFSAKTTISRKDFGLTWNVALEAGGFVVGDKVEITLEIEAVRKPATVAG